MLRTRRSRRLTALVTAAALALSLAACTAEEQPAVALPQQVDAALPEAVQTELQAAVEHAMAATASTGAIVGVWVPWAGTWVDALGTVTPEGREVTTDMTFKATAVTRAMTCDVLYGLVADDRVELDDSVTEWVSGLPGYEEITLGQLCDSTSGLGSYSGRLMGRWIANPERLWSARELAAYGMAQEPAFEAGSAYRDSDTGYVLLGLALERAADETMAQLLRRYVFGPISMTASSLPTNAPTGPDVLNGLRAGVADGAVDCAASVDLTALSPTAGFTASGVVSDITDLGRYVQSLAMGARSYDVESRFENPRPINEDEPSWFASTGGAYLAGNLIGQYGSMPGYLTAAFSDRTSGMAVAVVLNNSFGSAAIARSLAWQLAAVASKVPAASGQTAPEAGLPWTAESVSEDIDTFAVCPAS